MEIQEIEEIAESYINGNIGWVKGKVKSMDKLAFYYLLETISSIGDNDVERVAIILAG